MTDTTRKFGKADIHMHTIFSDGLMSPEALVEYVVHQTDLDVIAVTDHDTISGSMVAKSYYEFFADELRPLEIIIASEVTSRDGDIIALFIEEEIAPQMSAEETIAAIHEQGGLAIAAHPFAVSPFILRLDGMAGVGDELGDLPLDGVEIRNGTPTELFSNLWAWYRNRQGPKLATTGGSDTHYLPTVGSTHTRFPGRTAADLRQAIEASQTRPGGRVYSPFLAINLFMDMIRGNIPMRTLPIERAQRWPLNTLYVGDLSNPTQ